MFDKIRLHLFQRAFGRELLNVQRTMLHKRFEDIQSVLIVFDARTEDNVNSFLPFFEQMKIQWKAVKAVGITDQKLLPAYCKSIQNLDYIVSTDMKQNFVPKSDFINDITNTKFDLLLDLSFCAHPIVKWIVAFSQASFKAGSSCTNVCHYLDMVIDLDKRGDFLYLYSQIVQYLKLFK